LIHQNPTTLHLADTISSLPFRLPGSEPPCNLPNKFSTVSDWVRLFFFCSLLCFISFRKGSLHPARLFSPLIPLATNLGTVKGLCAGPSRPFLSLSISALFRFSAGSHCTFPFRVKDDCAFTPYSAPAVLRFSSWSDAFRFVFFQVPNPSCLKDLTLTHAPFSWPPVTFSL